MKSGRTKWMIITAAAVAVVATGLQFTSPVIPNPPVTGEFKGPEAVTAIFERACYDCHSNETSLEWYDKIAPVSWKVAAHVKEARTRLNFSNWDSLSSTAQLTTLWYIVNMVDQGKMPLESYTAVHPSARISKSDVDVLKQYVVSLTNARPTAKPAGSVPVKTAAVADDLPFQVSPSPNGISYFSDYKSWKVITSSNRFDNGTMRIIYGNDIAVKAIQENNIHPWPNGAKIVKVVWDKQAEDKDGNVFAGDFNNVQFMIKDDEKFRDTEGWGFARFSTKKLVPYGKTASFATECINCHRLASATGFVFDIPMK
ncbi:heme-binding domain-containing protein [Chitinophaga sp. 22620]